MRRLLPLALVLLTVSCESIPGPQDSIPPQLQSVTPLEGFEVLWGAMEFVRTDGAPNVYTSSITSPDFEHFEAPFVLYVQNGDGDGSGRVEGGGDLDRISSASVKLDGVEIFGKSDFSQQVSLLSAEVDVTDGSQLVVTLASKPGSGLTVWIEGTLKAGRARIGPEGGTVLSADGLARVVVPSQAVDEDVIILLNLTQTDGAIPGTPYTGAVVKLSPDDITFREPVHLKLSLPASVDLSEGAMFFWRKPGSRYLIHQFTFVDAKAHTVDAYLWHFSDYYLVTQMSEAVRYPDGRTLTYQVVNRPDAVRLTNNQLISVSEATEEAARSTEGWVGSLAAHKIDFAPWDRTTPWPDVSIIFLPREEILDLLGSTAGQYPYDVLGWLGLDSADAFRRYIFVNSEIAWYTVQEFLDHPGLIGGSGRGLVRDAVLHNVLQHEFGHALGVSHWNYWICEPRPLTPTTDCAEPPVMSQVLTARLPLALQYEDLVMLRVAGYGRALTVAAETMAAAGGFANGQRVAAGGDVLPLPAVRVTAADGTPIPGVTVLFSTPNSAVSSPVQVTDQNGLASPRSWTIPVGTSDGSSVDLTATAYLAGAVERTLPFQAQVGAVTSMARYMLDDSEKTALDYGISPVADRFGNHNAALYFNGLTDSLVINEPQILSRTEGTISFWLKLDDVNRQYYVFSTKNWPGYGEYGMEFQFGGGTPEAGPVDRFRFDLNAEAPSYSYVFPPAGAQFTDWHLYTVTWANGRKQIYLDGSLLGDFAAPASSPPDGSLVFGSNTFVRNEMLKGTLDDIRLYTRQLSGAEVRTLYDPNAPVVGSALRFDGTNDYVQISHNAAHVTPTLTVEAWVRLSRDITVANTQARIVNRQNDASCTTVSGCQGWGLEVFGAGTGGYPTSQLVLHSGNCSTNRNLLSGARLVPGTWHHVAGSNDGSTLRVFVDGVEVASTSAAGALCTTGVTDPIMVGMSGAAGGHYFPGDVDEIRVWNYARSATQINADMRASLPSNTSGLIGYWKFDEGQGTVAVDATGRSNGTLFNGPVWITQSR